MALVSGRSRAGDPERFQEGARGARGCAKLPGAVGHDLDDGDAL